MAKAGVEIKIDLSQYSSVLADKTAQLVATKVRILAKKFVAVDTGNLRNLIRVDKIEEANYEISVEAEYALAQEYGRPDLKNYTFTPYMRPAAKAVIPFIDVFVTKASRIALTQAKV
jgi:hypothetical protein